MAPLPAGENVAQRRAGHAGGTYALDPLVPRLCSMSTSACFETERRSLRAVVLSFCIIVFVR